ncbi:MAG TPA: UbiA family prenyltransferase [Bacteroidia bacterium]|nr:UbiA family prenyltransferase [Bacteroidia bacterium]
MIDNNTLKLLRLPFSFFLMPLFLFALSQSTSIIIGFKAVISFLIIHFLVYPASNGYNSYIDRDESPIGGLEKPPMPTKKLFYTTLVMDFLSVVLSLIFINPLFSLCILLYILASRAYSSKQIRIKKYPIWGFLVVVFFQGAFTFYTAYLGITNTPLTLNKATLFLLLGCSFQIAGAYPLTQVYQHKQDYKDGVITLSYKLGYTGTFIFTALMFFICNVCYFLYFNLINKPMNFYIIQLFFFPIVAYFAYWFYLVYKDNNKADFKNTMRMNGIAAICMNICFITLYFINK